MNAFDKIELTTTQDRMSLNVSYGSDMASSDVEDDNLNENLKEFERNILINEELDIRKSQSISSDFEIKSSHSNRRPSNSHIRPGNKCLFKYILD